MSIRRVSLWEKERVKRCTKMRFNDPKIVEPMNSLAQNLLPKRSVTGIGESN